MDMHFRLLTEISLTLPINSSAYGLNDIMDYNNVLFRKKPLKYYCRSFKTSFCVSNDNYIIT